MKKEKNAYQSSLQNKEIDVVNLMKTQKNMVSFETEKS